MYGFFDKAGELHQLRFFDLAPELRNVIYKLVAAAAFERPIAVVYVPPSALAQDTEPVMPPSPMKHHYEKMEARHRLHVTGMALLRINKQFHREARIIFYDAVRMNFRFALERSSSPKLTRTLALRYNKLQFISHITLDYVLASFFLFTPAVIKDWVQYHQADWTSDFQAVSHLNKKMMRARTLMYNLRTATIYPAEVDRYVQLGVENEAVGVAIITLLVDASYRESLSRMFPLLGDIVTSNSHGAERFRKIKSANPKEERWQLSYSKEVLPTKLREDHDTDDVGLYDQTSGLMVATTLALTGDLSGDEDEEGATDDENL
ncbi:hypothetical protein CLAFUW4_11608 [Fulvia fulva]|uniref:Uncharacterized protein n=1 Tax=Passalora fulva TaxID=5499 RepID=A0A9Q8PBX6_PASFU|nr:uncharacterized protein CLAFUR5_10653 [Fulvia fulva]KAK4619974.1 hypothetical protein CLAFUR4_11613 [Fulvia fulva]KAK4620921.1 hypothetical protein CLAFUR0_11622 [Fulvia fulva]UJO19638.1 hypothetical protein CLAFUR5_10653 [Fulvia fulva]WPV17680.1 hypothetical protein CLAFUW4_11608 [Fulvia fulva]WPV32131.1 hypothetical protein CLAFUW7_11612 [Fulvia fulva]